MLHYENCSGAEDAGDSTAAEEEEEILELERSNKTNSQQSKVTDSINNSLHNSHTHLYCIIILISAVLFGFTYTLKESDGKFCDFNYLKGNYMVKDNNFWYAVESSIKDIVEFNKPSVITFLYDGNSKIQLEQFLKELANYTNCLLDKNGANIIINGNSLNTKENMESFGNIIEYYKPILEQSGVMIVTDLDVVNSYVAQAFHSFCDEYTPLVANSLIVFTLKTDDLNGKHTEIADKILRKTWNKLKDDTLEPLLTRVIGIVLRFH